MAMLLSFTAMKMEPGGYLPAGERREEGGENGRNKVGNRNGWRNR